MAEFLYKIIPNVMDKQEDFFQAIWDTLVMAGWAGAFIIVFGLIVGVTLTVTRKDGIMQNIPLFQAIDKLVNLFRSIPFVILLASLMPLSRVIMGSAIGVKGAIVPLIIGAVPFYSRQVETALAEISPGKIEAALSMGCSPLGIIFRVYLRGRSRRLRRFRHKIRPRQEPGGRNVCDSNSDGNNSLYSPDNRKYDSEENSSLISMINKLKYFCRTAAAQVSSLKIYAELLTGKH